MADIVVRRRRRSRYNLLPGSVTPRRAISVLLIVLLLWGGSYAVRVVGSIQKITNQSSLGVVQGLFGEIQKKVGAVGGAAPPDEVARTNVAFYGFGGGNHDGAYLSDSIMVVSIQKLAGHPVQVAELSVPRDWYVPIDLGNNQTAWGRINEAYSSGATGIPHRSDTYSGKLGGGMLADNELEHLLGIHIDHFVGVDFHAFSAAVDDVGGVDINVPDSFVDYQYPSSSCELGPGAPCYDTTVRFTAGMQHMDGARALVFARSRHASGPEGSDFARSRRQQLIIQSLKAKASGFGLLTNGAALLSSLSDDVTTDISDVGQFSALYDTLKTVDTASIEHISIDDENMLYECGYPTNCDAAYIYAHDNSYATLHHFAQNVFPDPGVLAEKASITVYDGSGQGGGASGRWSSLLGMMTLASTDGGTIRRQELATHVIDNSGGRDAKTAAWLAGYFGVTVEQPTPPPTPAALPGSAVPAVSDAGVTVILGTNEERSFHNSSGTDPGNSDTSGGAGAGYSRPVATAAVPRRPAARRTMAPTTH